MLDVPFEMLPGAIGSRGPFAEAAPGTIGNRGNRAIPIGAVDRRSAIGPIWAARGQGWRLEVNLRHRGFSIDAYRQSAGRLAQPAADDGGARTGRRVCLRFGGLGVYRGRRDPMAARRGRPHQNCRRQPRPRAQKPHPHRTLPGAGVRRARRAALGCRREGRASSGSPAARLAMISCARRSIRSPTRFATCIIAMESDTGHRISELRADGGAVANPYLMQFQADLLDRPVVLPKIAETTAMGAAMLAGLAVGVWKSAAALDRLRQGGKVYRSKMRGSCAINCWPDGATRFRACSRITDTIPHGMDSKDQRPDRVHPFPGTISRGGTRARARLHQ